MKAKTKKEKEPREPKGSKLRFNWKIAIPLLVVVVAAAVVCLVLMRKGQDDGDTKKTEKLPSAYAVGQIEIPAMTAEKGEEVSWTQDAEGVYTYTGFVDNAAAAEDYVNELLDANLGFSLVDDGYTKIEAEDAEFTEVEGTVSIARNSEEAGKLYSIVIEWSEESCVVKMDIPEGTISEPKEASSSTLGEKMDYFKSLSPALLGLEGESMAEYEVYSMSGAILVDNNSCLQIKVYTKHNPEGTNDPCGIYLLSSDGLHLYRLDKQTETITELDIP